MEFLDQLSMKACISYSKIDYPEKPTLFFEFHGSSEDTVMREIQEVESIAKSNGDGDERIDYSMETEKRNHLWKARHELYYACLQLESNSIGLTTDVCVPVSNLTEMILGAQSLLDQNNLTGRGPILGHVGDGNIHCMVIGADGMRTAEFTHQLEK